MKTIKILFVLGLMSISSTGLTQNQSVDNRENITFAVKAGLNYSNMFSSRTEDFRADGKLGFAGGAALTIPIGEFFGLQPEVLLSQKGFKGNGVFLGTEYSFTRTTTYLDIPLQFALKPIPFVTILAGPQYSYLLKQRDDFNSSFINTSVEEEFNNQSIRNNIFGFVTGLDFQINHFAVGTRMGWDIMKNHDNGSSSAPQYKNIWVQATIGYLFYKK